MSQTAHSKGTFICRHTVGLIQELCHGLRSRKHRLTARVSATRWQLRFTNSYNKTNQMQIISQIYFWNKTLHVSDSSSVHHQEFFTVHTAMVYVIQFASRIRRSVLILLASCQQTCMTYTIAVCKWKTPDDGQRNCPKHVVLFQKQVREINAFCTPHLKLCGW